MDRRPQPDPSAAGDSAALAGSLPAGPAGTGARAPEQAIPPVCPVARQAFRLAELSNETASALRRLRRDLSACRVCPHDETCQIRSQLNAVIDSALSGLWDEWNREREAELDLD